MLKRLKYKLLFRLKHKLNEPVRRQSEIRKPAKLNQFCGL